MNWGPFYSSYDCALSAHVNRFAELSCHGHRHCPQSVPLRAPKHQKFEHARLGLVDAMETEENCITFNDANALTPTTGCTCPFYVQFMAPCVHHLKVPEQVQMISAFHPAWVLNNAPVVQRPNLSVPRLDQRVSVESRANTSFLNATAQLYQTILGLGPDPGMLYISRFNEMIRNKDPTPPPASLVLGLVSMPLQ